MANARKSHTSETVIINGGDNRVLVIGGFGSSLPLNSAELYNESTGTWSAAANMIIRRNNHTSSMLDDGEVLVSGGQTGTSANSATNSAEIYNPLLNTWIQAGNLSTVRFNHKSVLLNDGRVFVAGGTSASGSAMYTTEIYNPVTNTWSNGPTMSYNRAVPTLTMLPNGKVLIVAGQNASGSSLSKVEIFDPTTNTISNASSMHYSHRGHTANLITMSNGITQKVLIAGGSQSTNNSGQSELYDYINDKWQVTHDLIIGRSVHSSTVLNDGTVFVIGGIISSGTTNTSEYYTAP